MDRSLPYLYSKLGSQKEVDFSKVDNINLEYVESTSIDHMKEELKLHEEYIYSFDHIRKITDDEKGKGDDLNKEMKMLINDIKNMQETFHEQSWVYKGFLMFDFIALLTYYCIFIHDSHLNKGLPKTHINYYDIYFYFLISSIALKSIQTLSVTAFFKNFGNCLDILIIIIFSIYKMKEHNNDAQYEFSLIFFRSFSLLNIFHIRRRSKNIRNTILAYRACLPYLVVLYLIVIVLCFNFGALVYKFEDHMASSEVESLMDSSYFAMSSITTQGFGTVYPINPMSRICTNIMSMTGILLISCMMALLSSVCVQISAYRKQLEKSSKIKGNKYLKDIITGLGEHRLETSMEIVLDTLKNIMIPDPSESKTKTHIKLVGEQEIRLLEYLIEVAQQDSHAEFIAINNAYVFYQNKPELLTRTITRPYYGLGFIAKTRLNMWRFFHVSDTIGSSIYITVSWVLLILSIITPILSSSESFYIEDKKNDVLVENIWLYYLQIGAALYFMFDYYIQFFVCAEKLEFVTSAENIINLLTFLPLIIVWYIAVYYNIQFTELFGSEFELFVSSFLGIIAVFRFINLSLYLRAFGGALLCLKYEIIQIYLFIFCLVLFFTNLMFYLEDITGHTKSYFSIMQYCTGLVTKGPLYMQTSPYTSFVFIFFMPVIFLCSVLPICTLKETFMNLFVELETNIRISDKNFLFVYETIFKDLEQLEDMKLYTMLAKCFETLEILIKRPNLP